MKFLIRKFSWEHFFLFSTIFLIFSQEWGSYGDHKHYEDMYNGTYFYYLGPILDLLIYLANFLNLSSEYFWKSIACISAFVIAYLPSEIIKRTTNKKISLFTLFTIFSVVTFPYTLFILKAGFAFSIYLIGFYFIKFKNKFFGYILLIISSLTHLQFFIPSLLTFLIELNFKEILRKTFQIYNLKIYKSLIFSLLVIISISIIVIILGLDIKISERILEYITLYINYTNFNLISFNFKTLISLIFNLLLFTPYFLFIYKSQKSFSKKKELISNIYYLTAIPKLIFSNTFGVRRVFSSFNIFHIFAFDIYEKRMNLLYLKLLIKIPIFFGCLAILYRYFSVFLSGLTGEFNF